jgi:hypothetical protein
MQGMTLMSKSHPSSPPSLAGLDLNLLVALDALLTEGTAV